MFGLPLQSMSDDSNPTLTFSNTDETIEVRQIKTRNGVRVEIKAKESGESIRLDPIELESLTWQEKDDLAKLFAESTDTR
jgi:hypothetical protein